MNRGMWMGVAVLFIGVALQINVRWRAPDTPSVESAEPLDGLVETTTLPANWPQVLETLEPPSDRKTVDQLLRLTERFDDHEVGQQVLRTLERLGGSAGTRALYHLGNARPELTSEAATRLSRVRDREAAPALLEIVRASDTPVEFVAAALRSLGHTRLRHTVNEIASLAADRDRDKRTRVAATDALGWIADPRALPTLIALLESPTGAIRRRAIRSVGRIRAPEALEALETLVNSTPHDNERNLATDALARLRGEPVFRD